MDKYVVTEDRGSYLCLSSFKFYSFEPDRNTEQVGTLNLDEKKNDPIILEEKNEFQIKDKMTGNTMDKEKYKEKTWRNKIHAGWNNNDTVKSDLFRKQTNK